MPINLKNNTSLTATAHVQYITDWFLQKMKLSYFNYGRYYADGSRFNLSNRADLVDHYYQKDYQNIGKIERHPSCYSSCFMLWDSWDKDCISNKIVMKDFADIFNIAHGLSIIKSGKYFFDCFDFGTTKDNDSASIFYLSNMDLFEHFSLYFLEQAKLLIKKADNDRFFVAYDSKIDMYNEFPDTLLHAKKLKILDKHNKPFLTHRELTCVDWLLKGKTVGDLAIKLNISQRTAEKHLIHIKRKLSCQTMFQLGNKVSKLSIDKLLEFMHPYRKPPF